MNFEYRKPKNQFGIAINEFTARVGMTKKELAARAGVKYNTMIDTAAGRCAGHDVIPAVKRFMDDYQKKGV